MTIGYAVTITAGNFLERFVRWQWLVTIGMGEYMWIVWDVVHWAMDRKGELTITQAVLSLVITSGLPIMTAWYGQMMLKVLENEAKQV
jgi:hypothetical protein